MSRCLTLEEYLQEFVDENTQSTVGEEVQLLITDRQAQTLGFFLINGLAGFIERMRLERTQDQFVDDREDSEVDEFIN